MMAAAMHRRAKGATMKRGIALAALLALSPITHASDAYVDEVLKALEKKGLLSAQEVQDIKVNAREAERQGPRFVPDALEPGEERLSEELEIDEGRDGIPRHSEHEALARASEPGGLARLHEHAVEEARDAEGFEHGGHVVVVAHGDAA